MASDQDKNKDKGKGKGKAKDRGRILIAMLSPPGKPYRHDPLRVSDPSGFGWHGLQISTGVVAGCQRKRITLTFQ